MFDKVRGTCTAQAYAHTLITLCVQGCTFLCIFGLPHAKHEDEATRALRAARHIYNQLGELDLECFSIGVTTGVAFCGVVGHPQRHEYTGTYVML